MRLLLLTFGILAALTTSATADELCRTYSSKDEKLHVFPVGDGRSFVMRDNVTGEEHLLRILGTGTGGGDYLAEGWPGKIISPVSYDGLFMLFGNETLICIDGEN